MRKKYNYYPIFPEIILPQLKEVDLPSIYQVKLKHPCDNAIINIQEGIVHELDKSKRIKELDKSSNIAIAVGSRGISHIGQVIKEIVSYLKEHGHHCFIVPAMGSHGGAKKEVKLVLP